VSKRQRLPDPAISAVLELLVEEFPKCFAIFEQRRRPLKIGIREDILNALDGAITPAELARALRIYTANAAYRRKLTAGAARIDLAGENAGVVTPSQVPPRPIRQAAAPSKTPVKGPQRLSLADLRTAARRRRSAS
jgi:sRNA-binding protein